MTYEEMLELQRQNNFVLLCKPADAVEFHTFDYWQLPLERKKCKWEIKNTDEDRNDSSTTSR